MSHPRGVVCCLTVAGSDSGGGAGVQADLQTFSAHGMHGVSVVTCLTAQNPRRVSAIQPATPSMIRAQLEAVFEAFPVDAVKTGMLYDSAIIGAVASFLRERSRAPLVLDPVMVATSGADLLKPAAVKRMVGELFPLARVVTPNIPETEKLLGRRVRNVDAMREAARALAAQTGTAVLVKGGHLRGIPESVDILMDGRKEFLFATPRIKGVVTHGTGCTYASAIAAQLARGMGLAQAVEEAKSYLTETIRHSRRVGRHSVLNWRWHSTSVSDSGRRTNPG